MKIMFNNILDDGTYTQLRKNGKSTGIDTLRNEIIKDNSFLKVMKIMFNNILHDGTYTQLWKILPCKTNSVEGQHQ